MTRPLSLNVLDQSPIPAGATGADALRSSVGLAKATEALGCQRYWVAEHHGTPMLVCARPEVLIATIAASTSAPCVGSGGVMLRPRGDRVLPEEGVPSDADPAVRRAIAGTA